jgi:hypothetical protein
VSDTATGSRGRWEPIEGGARPRVPWYQRRAVLLAGGIVAIVAIAVVTDLPTTTSKAAEVAGANAFVKEVNADLAPCAYALKETYSFRADQLDGTLSQPDRAELPRLLADDRAACSLADPSIEDLTTGIESPGTTVQHQLGLMAADATRWVTADADTAIGAVQTLLDAPLTTTADENALVRVTRQLQRDRAAARAAIASADVALHASLDQVSLPAVRVPLAPRR